MRLLSALTILAYATGCQHCPEQYQEGVFMPAGSRHEVLADQLGLIYSMTGYERISKAKMEDVSLFHAIVLIPEEDVRGSGTRSRWDCLYGEDILTWRRGHHVNGPFDLPDAGIRLTFDGDTRTVSINGESFDASHNNCFLVLLDDQWQATATALPLRIHENLQPAELLAKMRRDLPGNHIVQNARAHSEAKNETAEHGEAAAPN